MKNNKKIPNIIVYLFIYLIFAAHSPWGQYLAYREQHLLIMSTREDAPTYPYSKILVDVINKQLPEASLLRVIVYLLHQLIFLNKGKLEHLLLYSLLVNVALYKLDTDPMVNGQQILNK